MFEESEGWALSERCDEPERSDEPEDDIEMIDVIIRKVTNETDKAWKIEYERKGYLKEDWFPKSRCTISGTLLLVPQWIYDQRGK